MKLHNLQPAAGSRKSRKRVGRGSGSGMGKTSGRGQKGQKARYSVAVGFEGGQTPLFRRLPKRGFTNPTRKEYAIVNVGDLNQFEAGTTVTPVLLVETGLLSNEKSGVKILGEGQLDKKLTVQAAKFSKAAEEAITSAGGSAEVI